MKLNFAWITDALFPPSADEMLIRHTTKKLFIAKLQIQRLDNNTYALASFKDPQVRAALHLVKFHNHTYAASLLGALLAAYLTTLPQRPYTIVPVPLSKKRQSHRGYNQVETTIRHALKDLPHMHLRSDVLKKVRHTSPQTSLSREERIHNLKDAFVMRQKYVAELANAHIILIDDVITTGTTLAHAKAALAPAHETSIISLGLAH